MAYIRIDIDKLSQTISRLEQTISDLNHSIDVFNTEVVDLGEHWQGEDYDQFASEVREIRDYDSVQKRLEQALESYNRFLKDAKTLYERARNNAYARANNVRFW